MEKTTKIPLFRRCVIQNFPFIEEDFDALTDYGLLCKVVEYLNKVINQTNINSEQVEELSTAFNSLKSYVDNYFDNLDVQDEINTKLEAMAASGQLAEIISQYLNSTAIFGFDNVAAMTAAENLVNGSYARTLGYTTKNDGGGALYKIRTITNDDVVDGSFIIEMGDGSDQLIAEYVKSGDIYVEQLGALGLADSTSKLQDLIDYAIDNDIVLKFGNNTYNITSLEFKTAKLKFDNTTFNVLPSAEDVAIKIASPYKGCTYSDFVVHGIKKTGIRLNSMKNITLRRIRIEECKIGVDVVSGYELTLTNSLLVNTEDIVDGIGIQMNTSDCVFDDIVIQGYRTGVKTLDNCIGVYWNKIHIWSTIADTVLNSIGFDLYGSGDIQNCTLDTCLIGVKVRRREKVCLTNCRWYWNSTWFTDEILDGATPYMVYFDDKHYTNWFDMYNCYGYKPNTVTTLYFSNISQENWEGLCNIKYNNRNIIFGGFAGDIPVGQIGSLATPDSFTDSQNVIHYSLNGFDLDYVGLIASDATTGQVDIGYVNKDLMGNLDLNALVPYGSQWSAENSGFAYLYINATTGKVTTKITEAMRGKYLKIHLSYTN